MALAGEDPPGTAAEVTETLRTGIEQTIAAGRLNPWCELCKAPRDAWSFEIATLENRTLADVWPALKREEAAQLETQAVMKAEARHSRN